jgi:hypothetical protein
LRGLCFHWGLYFFHALRECSHHFAPIRAGFGYSFGYSRSCQLQGILALVRADISAGVVMGQHGMTAHDWNIIAGIYFKKKDDSLYGECAVFQSDA